MKEFGFVERILTKCQHFTAIKSIDARMVVLDIIAKGMSIKINAQLFLFPDVRGKKEWKPSRPIKTDCFL
jgi:hypothetical protein